MRFNKTTIILTIFVMVWAFGTPSGLIGKSHNHGPDVEEIYQSIRNAAPLYEWDESTVTFENEGMTLVCSLTIPRTQHLCPIVISLNGFGGDRNDLVIPGTDEPFFQRFSRIMAEQGIASLRVDFRGSGESDGEFQMTTFSTQISDALAALNYIRRNLRHQVNIRSIGIMGFSQGGLVASTTAAKDKRVDSLVLWSPATFPPHEYEGLITKEGILRGLNMESGGYDIFPLYLNGEYLNWDLPLGKEFFEDLFNIDPVAEIRKVKNPLMVIVGKNDPIVWPQPAKGQLYMKYHRGNEKLVALDMDHAFNNWAGPEGPDTAFYWSTAWFIKTLKHKNN
ncbi:MAG: alpha/beta fold hydrolase [Candidatus Aminicenantes bacterium]|jgi:dienelactone hydrolase